MTYHPAIAMPNLLYTYAERIDAGEHVGAVALFRRGHVVSAGQRIAGEAAIVAMWPGWAGNLGGHLLKQLAGEDA